MRTRPATEDERPALAEVFTRAWGAPWVVSRGRRWDLRTLPTLVADTDDGRLAGVAVHRLEGAECEIVSLNALIDGVGAGTALLDATRAAARAAGCRRLWLITTNDNTPALRFYQRRGMRLAAIHPGAVDEARRTLKPEIPERGRDGIPIRDEIVLEDLL